MHRCNRKIHRCNPNDFAKKNIKTKERKLTLVENLKSSEEGAHCSLAMQKTRFFAPDSRASVISKPRQTVQTLTQKHAWMQALEVPADKNMEAYQDLSWWIQ
jgi:hypothetical protein